MIMISILISILFSILSKFYLKKIYEIMYMLLQWTMLMTCKLCQYAYYNKKYYTWRIHINIQWKKLNNKNIHKIP